MDAFFPQGIEFFQEDFDFYCKNDDAQSAESTSHENDEGVTNLRVDSPLET